MTAPLPTPLPYGLRDVKLTPYADALGTILGDESVDLPNAQTFTFSEAEEFQELRGDDAVVTTHGQGSTVDWSLESGGIALEAWVVMTGGEIIEGGTTPDRNVIFRKKGSAVRPYFRVEGQSISDSGGDVHAIVYRCRVNGTLGGDFSDGAFFITSANGVGLPLLEEATDNDLLYDFVQNETKKPTPLTPESNPTASGKGDWSPESPATTT